MADYDYHQLSPDDFEDFVRDLLQAEWKVRIESFKTGRDGGIDFRYSGNSGDTIIQCKHYVRTGLPGLLSNLRKEVKKVRKLKPSRYVLATSVGLTPLNKDEIVEIIGGDTLKQEDVLGQDDLNNRLGHQKDVEGRHYKLWLASRAVLDRVIHNDIVTQSEFKVRQVHADICRYVRSEAYPAALDILQRDRVVIIAGPPGVGKTTLANMLLYRHLEWEYKAVVVQRDPGEGIKLFQMGENAIFYYDDFLGTTFLGDHSSVLTRNGDRAILGLIDQVQASKTARLVMTTREHILQQAYARSEKMAHSSIEDHKLVLHMSSYTFSQKAKILYNHLYFSDLPPAYQDEILRGDFYLQIIKHKKFNPRLIEWLATFRRVRNQPLAQYRNFIENLLDDPSQIWEHAYYNEISDAARSLLLALFTFDGSIAADLLQAGFALLHAHRAKRYNFATRPEDFRSAVRELAGAFVTVDTDQSIKVLDPSVLDLVNSVLMKGPENVADLLVGASMWSQVQRVWGFASDPSRRDTMSALSTARDEIAGSLGRILLESRRVDLGNGTIGFRGPTLERRLAILIQIADQLRSPRCVELIVDLTNHLKAEWDRGWANLGDGADLIAVFDRVTWPELRRMAEAKAMCRTAMINAAHDVDDLDDLQSLVDVLGDDVPDELGAALRNALYDFERHHLDDVLKECKTSSEIEALIESLEKLETSLSADLSHSKESMRERLEEVERQEAAYEDHMADEYKERWRDDRQTDDSVRDLFSSLKDDRD